MKGRLRLQEMLPSFDEMWVKGPTGPYVAEFIVPFKRRPVALGTTPVANDGLITNNRVVDSAERLKLPGSDWVYVKLYSGPGRHNDLLADPIREFASMAQQTGLIQYWFFIRYADPDPHLRLRFHGNPERLLTHFLPALLAWGQTLVTNGLVRNLVLDSYDRELERYGGNAGLQIAEQIFAIDSAAITQITQLTLKNALPLAQTDLALITVDDLLTQLGVVAEERRTLYRMIRQGQETSFNYELTRLHQTFHDYRKTAQRLVGDRAWLLAKEKAIDLTSILQARAKPLQSLGQALDALAKQEHGLSVPLTSFLASCVHMHCNRLLGVNRPLEFEVMFYLDRTFEALARYQPPGIQVF
jgi:thiopeptide-type bacteriocin biosynthesis protein